MQEMARESWASFKSKRECKLSEEWGNLINEEDPESERPPPRYNSQMRKSSLDEWDDELVYSPVGDT